MEIKDLITLLRVPEGVGDPKCEEGLLKLKDWLGGMAKELFYDKGGVEPAGLALFDMDGEHLIGFLPMGKFFNQGGVGEVAAVETLAKFADLVNAYAFMFIAESVVAIQPEVNGEYPEYKGMEAIDDSEKIEAITITYEHKHIGCGLFSATIITKENGEREVKEFLEPLVLEGNDRKKSSLGGAYSRVIPSRNLNAN